MLLAALTLAAALAATEDPATTDRAAVAAAVARVAHEPYLDALIVAQHGATLAEHYLRTSSRTELHPMRSATKSLISAALGIALGRERVNAVERPVFETLREWLPEARGPRARITFQHVLTMTPGLACNPPDERHDPCDPRQAKTRYPWKEFLEAPMRDEPGTKFNYSDAAPAFVLAFIYALSHEPPADFVRDRLYRPLGFSADASLTRLSIGDMLKFGQLFLQNGCWNGAPLVPREWVAASTAPHWMFAESTGRVGYGYFWWWRKMHWRDRDVVGFMAEGNGGQLILVVPELDAVVVTTASAYDNNTAFDRLLRAVVRDILPALAPETPVSSAMTCE